MIKLLIFLLIHTVTFGHCMSKTKSFYNLGQIQDSIQKSEKCLHFKFKHKVRDYGIEFHLIIEMKRLVNLIGAISHNSVLEELDFKSTHIFYFEEHQFNRLSYLYLLNQKKNENLKENALSIVKESVFSVLKGVFTELIQCSLSIYGPIMCKLLEINQTSEMKNIMGRTMENYSISPKIYSVRLVGVCKDPLGFFRVEEYADGPTLFSPKNKQILTFENEFTNKMEDEDITTFSVQLYDFIGHELSYTDVISRLKILDSFIPKRCFLKVIKKPIKEIATIISSYVLFLEQDILKPPINPSITPKEELIKDILKLLLSLRRNFSSFLLDKPNSKIEVIIDVKLWYRIHAHPDDENMLIYYEFNLNEYTEIDKYNRKFMLKQTNMKDEIPRGVKEMAQYYTDKTLEIVNLLKTILEYNLRERTN